MASVDDSASFNIDTYEGSNSVQVKQGYLIMFASLVFFLCINWLAIQWGPPKRLKSDVWRWRNTFISWIHADIIGVGVIYCFLFRTEMLKDMILYCDWYLYTVVAASCGYFWYDLFDHIVNKRMLSNWEVMLHHFGVIWTLWYALHYQVIIGYSVLALVIEINSIFLHGRKLLQLTQWPYDHWFYKVVQALNFITFIVCRMITVILLSLNTYRERKRISFLFLSIITPILVVMYFINGILLWRLFKTDVLRRFKKASAVKKEKMEINGNSENGHVHNSNHLHSH